MPLWQRKQKKTHWTCMQVGLLYPSGLKACFSNVLGFGFKYNPCLTVFNWLLIFFLPSLKLANPFFLFLPWLQESCTVKQKFPSWEPVVWHTLNVLLHDCYMSKKETGFVSFSTFSNILCCQQHKLLPVATQEQEELGDKSLPFLKTLSVENSVKFSGEWDGFHGKLPISSCAKGGSVFRPPLDGCEPASAWCRRSCTSGRKDNLCSEEVFDPCFIRCCSLVPQAKDLWGLTSWSRWVTSEQATSLWWGAVRGLIWSLPHAQSAQAWPGTCI